MSSGTNGIGRTGGVARRITPQQIGQQVRHFFDCTGITYNRTLADRLKRYSLDQIQQITGRVGELQGSFEVRTLIIDDVNSVPEGFDFNSIPAEQLKSRLVNGTLNLMGNWQAAEPFAAPYATLSAPPITPSDPSITKLGGSTVALMTKMGEIGQAIATFAQLPDTKVADIYGMLEAKKEELGFLNVSILRPVGEGRWVRSQSTRSWGPTKYDPATGGNVPEGTLKSVIDGGNAPHLYDVDINDRSTFEAAGLVFDEASVARDLAGSKGPGRMLFIVLQGRNGVRAVVQIHSRINLDETIETPPVLPENVKEAEALKGALSGFFVSFNLALQVAMERELVTSSGERVAFAGAALKADDTKALLNPHSEMSREEINHKFMDFVKARAKVSKFGIFRTAELSHPVINYTPDEQELLVSALNWSGRDREDMKAHLLRVSNLVVAFHNGKPVAFTSGEAHNFNNQKKPEVHLTIVGVMVDPEYYGYHLQAFIVGLYMIRSWWNCKMDSFWSRLVPIMRTNSVSAASSFMDHFSNVVCDPVTPTQKFRAEKFAHTMGQPCDAHGVFKQAYTQPISDRERDQKVLRALSKKNPVKHKRLAKSLGELTEYDCRTFQGVLTLKNVLWFWLNCRFLFGYQSRKIHGKNSGQDRSAAVA